MSTRRGGLGRGLGALIPTGPAVPGGVPGPATPPPASAPPATPAPAPPAPAAAGAVHGAGNGTVPWQDGLNPVPGARFAELPVAEIAPNPRQPRQVFDEEALGELQTSIQEVGFLQPIVVRELAPHRYELVMGERRWRAAQALGRELIPAIIRETKDDALLRDALLENIHRANLNPLEEAAAYQQLLEEFGATHDELARRIGRSRSLISNTIRLLNLPAAVQRRVAAGVLTAGHARALLALEDGEQQDALATRIVAEGLSVRATEELVALALAEAPAPKAVDAKRRARPYAPALSDLADRLADRFDTRVKVDLGRNKGKIVIEFATVDDLERIVAIIGIAERDGGPGGTGNGTPGTDGDGNPARGIGGDGAGARGIGGDGAGARGIGGDGAGPRGDDGGNGAWRTGDAAVPVAGSGGPEPGSLADPTE